MGVRNCAEIGENLQKIMGKLMSDQKLLKLLYYTDKDPLSHTDLSQAIIKEKIYNQLIRIIPKVTDAETANSIVVLRVLNGVTLSGNTEFKTVNMQIMVFVPLTQWIIKDTNLRPFAILGRIQEDLEGLTINGLGKLTGGDFTMEALSEEMGLYTANYSLISYD